MNEAPENPADTLARLREQGAHRFDPVRFHYLESLARRLWQNERPSNTHRQRLCRDLADFDVAFHQARTRAQHHLGDSDDQRQALYQAGDFKALARLARQQAARARRPPLAALTATLAEQPTPQPARGRDPLDTLLQQHWANLPQPRRKKRQAPKPATAGRELRALRQARAGQAKRRTEQRIDRALAQPPQDAGPLNAHRLVTGALERMRDISPDYVHRLVGYLDALMALEKRGGR